MKCKEKSLITDKCLSIRVRSVTIAGTPICISFNFSRQNIIAIDYRCRYNYSYLNH